jgi:hypothetical protein
MTRRHAWFLPETPDVLGMLHAQFEVTLEGVQAFDRWAAHGGDPEAALAVRDAEHRADGRKLDLRRALRSAFSTPLDSEDLYMISEALDEVMNEAKNTVREAEVLAIAPDEATAAMTALVVEGVGHLEVAVTHVLDDADLATAEADAATKCERRMEKVYRAAAAGLVDGGDLREGMARREVYGRTLRVGEHMVSVSERVWYAVVKEA